MPSPKPSTQFGFNLIELMVVLAIIGVLSGIAIPQYQTYMGRTQFLRVVNEAALLKRNLDACIVEGKLTIPNVAPVATECDPMAVASNVLDDVAGGAQAGNPAPTAGVNGYPRATIANDGSATITATFGNSALPVLKTAGKNTVIWTRDASGTWMCASTVLGKYASPACPSPN